MRALVLADIHSNLEALEAVLEDARLRGGFDHIWCLGDTVGYGPDPGACVELLQAHSNSTVVGNHDLAAVGLLSTSDFNAPAAHAVHWTAAQLEAHQVHFLSALPEVLHVGDFTLVHGSLRAPVHDYLASEEAAMGTFALLHTPFCLVGHSHIPFVCREVEPSCSFEPFHEDIPLTLGEERLIINPGGVGQPRDHDPRPSYAIYDGEAGTIERHRVTYQKGTTQEKMLRALLPEGLIRHLDVGV